MCMCVGTHVLTLQRLNVMDPPRVTVSGDYEPLKGAGIKTGSSSEPYL